MEAVARDLSIIYIQVITEATGRSPLWNVSCLQHLALKVMEEGTPIGYRHSPEWTLLMKIRPKFLPLTLLSQSAASLTLRSSPSVAHLLFLPRLVLSAFLTLLQNPLYQSDFLWTPDLSPLLIWGLLFLETFPTQENHLDIWTQKGERSKRINVKKRKCEKLASLVR
jgi:hypothetical protein